MHAAYPDPQSQKLCLLSSDHPLNMEHSLWYSYCVLCALFSLWSHFISFTIKFVRVMNYVLFTIVSSTASSLTHRRFLKGWFNRLVNYTSSYLRVYRLMVLGQSTRSSLIQRAGVGWSLTGNGPPSLTPLFSFRSGSALAQLYGTSATLEHHHFNHAVMILQSEVQT